MLKFVKQLLCVHKWFDVSGYRRHQRSLWDRCYYGTSEFFNYGHVDEDMACPKCGKVKLLGQKRRKKDEIEHLQSVHASTLIKETLSKKKDK